MSNHAVAESLPTAVNPNLAPAYARLTASTLR